MPRARNQCDTCVFLSRLPDKKYRDEVIEAMADRQISTPTILRLLEADGNPLGVADGALNRHRAGNCGTETRKRLLGDASGIIRS